MKVAVYVAFVFIIAVLRPEYGRTHRTSEVLYVIFPLQSRDIRIAECTSTFEAKQILTAIIISLTKGYLTNTIGVF